MKKVNVIVAVIALTAGLMFAGSLVGVSPSNAIEGGNITLTIEAESISLTGETVLAVNLVKGELAIGADSFTTLSDTLIEAEFDLSGNPDRGLWSIEVDLQSGTLTLEDCLTIYDPDIDGDGFVDIDDFSLYAKHFLELKAGYTLVPDLISLSQSAAEQDILNAGLVLGTVEEVFSDTVDTGLVISQNPASGVLMLSGAIVNLVVSKGQEPVIVPDLSSINQTDAENAIIAAELSVGAITEQYSSTVTAGLVISQSPLAGESVAPGSAVDLVVSLGEEPIPDITWISINDPGFVGEMSVYETTNAQFAQYLNDALGTGDIIVEGSYVLGASGEYTGQNYYRLDGSGYTYDGATNGGKSRINYSGGAFTVDSGFENHPVTYVTWYGASAFAAYYGWRLPTEWEWQATASYDGAYTYGCGNTINNSIANYSGSYHPHGTTPVGQYGTFGYGLADMAGNVYEWTITVSDSFRVVRGGGWNGSVYYCAVSSRSYNYPFSMGSNYGFRVCR